ncbi:unnamed protein product [Echinostoma caproni]|uniref:Reverse transcriptase domain-containing protein n=1 Tax=Echinostoma caproni TaxID=27848 RepID=A0A183BCH4_9TREM|nr:unnamed protein product [Echinostoma caproni]
MLFLLFVNDLVQELPVPVFIIADDVRLVNSGPVDRLEDDPAKVVRWTQKWDLELNASKCHVLNTVWLPVRVATTTKPTVFARVDRMLDLGISVREDLKPSDQCLVAAQNARRQLFQLKAALSSRNAEVFLPLHKAMVRPQLEYCVQALAPYLKKNIICLERFQSDLVECLDDPCFLYADDVKLIGNPNSETIQSDQSKIYQSSVLWDLPLNVSKFQRLIAQQEEDQSRRLGSPGTGSELDVVTEAKNLGIMIQADFKKVNVADKWHEGHQELSTNIREQ